MKKKPEGQMFIVIAAFIRSTYSMGGKDKGTKHKEPLVTFVL